MHDIQLDMFEVQLGAAILIQARVAGQAVSILADGGIGASGYSADHVRRQLPAAMDAFEPGRRRIDLVIGTHYDRDHLDGLVPVIDDGTFEIGEAWMPPILDDQDPPPRGRAIEDGDYLGNRLSGGERLARYVDQKLRQCQELEFAHEEVMNHAEDMESTMRQREPDESSIERQVHQDAPWVREAMRRLDWHRRESKVILDDAGARPGDPVAAPGESNRSISRSARGSSYRRGWGTRRPFLTQMFDRIHVNGVKPGAGAAASLAYLRFGTASDAINAVALDAVVGALRRRGIPTSYKIIDPGTPRSFTWDPIRHIFDRGDSPLRITLLGPSETLVRKHATRLPIGRYALRMFEARIPVASITPSNQLSYVARVDAHGERVLVTGDAGMVDFHRGRTMWHKRLLAELSDLDVIQVAHHAGNNAYFYEALLAAPDRTKDSDEFYLLSHARHDVHRPSKPFELFLTNRELKPRAASRLLFTSEPDAWRVEPYRALIDPVVGARADVGNVQLQFDGGWHVRSHAIAVP
jgi:hypothetical protein